MQVRGTARLRQIMGRDMGYLRRSEQKQSAGRVGHMRLEHVVPAPKEFGWTVLIVEHQKLRSINVE